MRNSISVTVKNNSEIVLKTILRLVWSPDRY